MKFRAVDGNHKESECGRYTISWSPSMASATLGCDLVFILWAGKAEVAVERCKNYAEERIVAMESLMTAADSHAGALA